jgi:uncharacterized membrane protein
MDLALFSMDGLMFALRWFHIFFGIVWIGLLYYFNFVQGSFFAETDAPTKSQAIQKLVPRALWWFRYGALWTWVLGVVLLSGRGHMGFSFATSWGVSILVGAALGTFMFLNVWGIIWRNQKVVIASAAAAATGGAANPQAAAAAAKAGLASRTNTLFSIPMLFFMASANHLSIVTDESSNFMLCTVLVAAVLIALEVNAVKGKMGPMTTVKGVIGSGFALTAVLYAIVEFTL